MKCPYCNSWTYVKDTRTRKTDGARRRMYLCANEHRFTTIERVYEVPVHDKRSRAHKKVKDGGNT